MIDEKLGNKFHDRRGTIRLFGGHEVILVSISKIKDNLTQKIAYISEVNGCHRAIDLSFRSGDCLKILQKEEARSGFSLEIEIGISTLSLISRSQ